jgi:hypothetical protein
MGVPFAAERRLLAEEELAPIQRSHHPTLASLTREETLALARWLRERRDRAGGLLRDRRRARRGKATGDGAPSERGLAAKKQVFAHAIRRVNKHLAEA